MQSISHVRTTLACFVSLVLPTASVAIARVELDSEQKAESTPSDASTKQGQDISRLREEAKRGVKGAALALGRYLFSVENDQAAAFAAFSLGASQGDPACIDALAICLEAGFGTKQDVREAARLYERAADLGHVDSHFSTARHYYHGIGYPRDIKLAVSRLRVAAELGHTQAAVSLARIYRDGAAISRYGEDGVLATTEDKVLTRYYLGDDFRFPGYKEVRRLLRIGARGGDVSAMVELATELSVDGGDVRPDQNEAVYWLEEASARGHAEASIALANAYLEERGVAKDVGRATALLEAAANSGVASAARLLATIHLGRFGQHVDFESAIKWFSVPSLHNDLTSNVALAKIHAYCLPESDANWKKAIVYFQRASLLGDPESTRIVAFAKLTAKGLPLNVSEGVAEMRKAASLGDSLAMRNVVVLLRSGDAQPIYQDEEVHLLRRAAALGNADAKEWLRDAEGQQRAGSTTKSSATSDPQWDLSGLYNPASEPDDAASGTFTDKVATALTRLRAFFDEHSKLLLGLAGTVYVLDQWSTDRAFDFRGLGERSSGECDCMQCSGSGQYHDFESDEIKACWNCKSGKVPCD